METLRTWIVNSLIKDDNINVFGIDSLVNRNFKLSNTSLTF